HYQTPPCPACGKPVFVLGRSPYHSPTDVGFRSAAERRTHQGRTRSWLGPVLAGMCTLAAVIVIYWLILHGDSRPATRTTADAHSATPLVIEARKALSQGEFQLGLEKIQAAEVLRRERPAGLSPAESRQIVQLHRQAELVANL